MRTGRSMRRYLVALVALVAFALSATSALALDETDGPDVTPQAVSDGNIIGGPPPDSDNQDQCVDWGYDWGLSTGGNTSGTYNGVIPPATTGSGTPVSIQVRFNADRSVDFESTVPVEAAAIKGGPEYTMYDYNLSGAPGAQTHDDGLITARGQSHAVFCFDYQDGSGNGTVVATKTAVPKWERGFIWELKKEVDKDLWKLFSGDTAVSKYTVTATATSGDKVTVSGKITIQNDTSGTVTVTGISDIVDQGGALTAATVTGCTFPFDIAAGQSASCDYNATLPSADDGVNNAIATVEVPKGGSAANYPATTEVDVPADPTIVGNETATLTDNSPAWTNGTPVLRADESPHVFNYQRTFDCTNPGDHKNTATLDPTDSDAIMAMKTVSIMCFDLTVDKTADVEFKRVWHWKIKKYASHKQVVLARKKDPDAKKGVLFLSRYAKQAIVQYAVKVDAEERVSGAKITGYIDVTNPQGSMRTARITSVSDTLLDPAFPAEVSSCRILEGDVIGGSSYGYDIPEGKTLRCNYLAMPSGKSAQNKATATLQNYAFEVDKAQAIGTMDYMKTVGIDWDVPASMEVDKKARVYDSKMGFLGWVTAPGPKRFSYSLLVKPGGLAPLCGKSKLRNRASVVGEDTKNRAEDSVAIPVTVLCFEAAGSDGKKDGGDAGGKKTVDPKINPDDPGVSINNKGQIDGVKADETLLVVCLPSKHYTGKRGAKGDPTWKKIGPKGMKTRFFRAGKKVTYAKAMRMRGKNPYHRLAGAYVIAKLHALSGAPLDAKTSRAIVWADRYLAKTKPSATNPKRGLSGAKAKKVKRLMAKNTKVLKRFSKRAKPHHGPSCDTANV